MASGISAAANLKVFQEYTPELGNILLSASTGVSNIYSAIISKYHSGVQYEFIHYCGCCNPLHLGERLNQLTQRCMQNG